MLVSVTPNHFYDVDQVEDTRSWKQGWLEKDPVKLLKSRNILPKFRFVEDSRERKLNPKWRNDGLRVIIEPLR